MLAEARGRGCGKPVDEDISLVDYYGVHPQDLPSQFEPRDFPPRECRPVVRRRSRAEIRCLIEAANSYDDF